MNARYSLRTLLILLSIGPPLVAGVWLMHREDREKQERLQAIELELKEVEAEWNTLQTLLVTVPATDPSFSMGPLQNDETRKLEERMTVLHHMKSDLTRKRRRHSRTD